MTSRPVSRETIILENTAGSSAKHRVRRLGRRHILRQGWHLSDSQVMIASLPCSARYTEESLNYTFKSRNHRHPPHELFVTKAQMSVYASSEVAC